MLFVNLMINMLAQLTHHVTIHQHLHVNTDYHRPIVKKHMTVRA